MAPNKKVKKTKKAKNKTSIIRRKIRNICLTLLLIAVAVYTIYIVMDLIITPTETFIVENGVVSVEETTIGYIVREETIVKGNNYENGMLQIKTEGEKVAVKENIFRYLSKDENTINDKIEELNVEIQEAMQGQTDLFSSDIKMLDNQIDAKVENIKYKNSIQEIKEYKNDVLTYLNKKSVIAGDLSASGTYINDLLNQKENYENELAQNSEYVKAPVSGVVSYRVDNLEETLKPNNWESLNKKFLDDLNLKTGQIITTSTQMGKIVNNYEAYIVAALKSDEAKKAEVNDKITLRLSNDETISAKIVYKAEDEEKNIILVFKVTDAIENLIGYRKISFDIIWWSIEGLKIPNDSILYDNGLSYVVRNRAGYLDKILIKVLQQNDKYCTIRNYSTEELLEMGYSNEEIKDMKKITIYDEIVADPKTENLS